jgi:DNA-binding Lrp family transcriptional regulator
MNAILTLLKKNALYSAADIAAQLGRDEADVAAQISELEKSGVILGYQAIIDNERLDDERVSAFIEVKLTPERNGGFNRLAERISKFDQVSSCYLMSGGYDLMVIVEGDSLRSVAKFVAEKLSTQEGVLSTATHFHLKTYKQGGFLARTEMESNRLPVAP